MLPTMQSAKTSVVAQAIEKRDDGLFIYDMGEPVVGVVAFDVSLPAPGALSVHYGEVLPELRSSQAPETPWFRQPRDRWKGKAGVQTLTGDGRRAFRYFSVQWPDARAGHVERVSIVSKPHFVEERGYFRCSDPLLNKIWTISSRTTRLCMRAYYEDGVKRDGLLWLGDCRVQYLCNTGVFGDTELMKTSLRMVAASQNEDGSVPACAAKGGGHRHPEAGYTAADRIDYMPTIPRFPSQWLLQNYMWDYVSSVREYVLFSGDLDTGHELCDSLCRVLRWLAKHGNPLEARPGHDYFTDNGFQEDGHIFARPRALRAQGLAACRDAEQLADWLGRPELACWAVAAKNTLRPTLPSEGKRPCWHSVFLERLAGIGSRDEWIRASDNPNALRPRSAYMWYW
ncbi:MAG: hypothetical protein K9N51_01675, partial [Candidatus Pacebacteria bacterium]|nr:hypothetical protein [Candidatus Paceibacterota bacterium]